MPPSFFYDQRQKAKKRNKPSFNKEGLFLVRPE